MTTRRQWPREQFFLIRSHHAYSTYDAELGLYTGLVFPTGTHADSIDHALVYGSGLAIKLYNIITDEYALYSTDHCPVLVDFDIK